MSQRLPGGPTLKTLVHTLLAGVVLAGGWMLVPGEPAAASAYGCALAGGTAFPPQPWYICQDLAGSGVRVNSSTAIFQAAVAVICFPQARFRYTPRSTGAQVTWTSGTAGNCGVGVAAYGQWFGFDMRNGSSFCAAQKNDLNKAFSPYQCHGISA